MLAIPSVIGFFYQQRMNIVQNNTNKQWIKEN